VAEALSAAQKAIGDFAPKNTHMAFYTGWPNAMTAITQLKDIVNSGETHR